MTFDRRWRRLAEIALIRPDPVRAMGPVPSRALVGVTEAATEERARANAFPGAFRAFFVRRFCSPPSVLLGRENGGNARLSDGLETLAFGIERCAREVPGLMGCEANT
jgi:hypothetical protein